MRLLYYVIIVFLYILLHSCKQESTLEDDRHYLYLKGLQVYEVSSLNKDSTLIYELQDPLFYSLKAYPNLAQGIKNLPKEKRTFIHCTILEYLNNDTVFKSYTYNSLDAAFLSNFINYKLKLDFEKLDQDSVYREVKYLIEKILLDSNNHPIAHSNLIKKNSPDWIAIRKDFEDSFKVSSYSDKDKCHPSAYCLWSENRRAYLIADSTKTNKFNLAYALRNRGLSEFWDILFIIRIRNIDGRIRITKELLNPLAINQSTMEF